MSNNWISLNDDGGIKKKILVEGEGDETPPAGDEVYVHYVGTLESDNSKFDSSRDREEPFTFVLGKGAVIKGWDVGVATMKKGEKCILRCEAKYAYGASGSPPKIPANATLLFEVELLEWKEKQDDLTYDGGVLKKTLKSGKSEMYDTPSSGATATVHYVGRLEDGTEFINTRNGEPTTFIVGDGAIIKAIEKAVQKMSKGELARVTVEKPKYAYGSEGSSELNVPADAKVIFEIELLDFENEPSIWNLEHDDKVEYANKKKTEGNDFYKASNWKLAAKRYTAALQCFEHATFNTDQEDEEQKATEIKRKEQADAINLTLHNNLAATYLKQKKYKDAITQSDKAIGIDSKNIKALFRKAQALDNLGDWDDAKGVYTKILQIEQHKPTKAALAKLSKKIKAHEEQEKAFYAKMF